MVSDVAVGRGDGGFMEPGWFALLLQAWAFSACISLATNVLHSCKAQDERKDASNRREGGVGQKGPARSPEAAPKVEDSSKKGTKFNPNRS